MAIRSSDIETLQKIASFEETTPESQYPLGWSWQQVRVWPSTLSRMVIEGYLEITFSSNSYTGYRLTQKGKALAGAAEPDFEGEEIPDQALELPEDIFEPIEGYLDIKELTFRVLKADKPVHLLFSGVPASAKTMFLMELSQIKGAVYILGSQSTKAGIAETLFELKPKLLLVDEIDRIGAKDIAVLLSLAET
ncbi:MAG: AAA family ATPase, partial [Chloroflexi bacterium]|nr:AAA family ATPase [Chloroflexota bacterium]